MYKSKAYKLSRIELNALSELKRYLSNSETVYKQADFELSELKQVLGRLRGLSEMVNNAERAKKTLFNYAADLGSAEFSAARAAKDLGINPDSIKEVPKSKQLRKKMKEREMELSRLIKEANRL